MTDTTDLLQGFPPVYRSDARILILGSMPGVRSLAQHEYYAHPQNAFWKIMQSLFAIDRRLPYEQRLQQLREHHIALWDVVRNCMRDGSLDANIHAHTVIANDFPALLVQCKQIRHIFFNGQKAAALWRRHVQNTLHTNYDIELHTLPSTSPAHAGKTLRHKLEEWRVILDYCA